MIRLALPPALLFITEVGIATGIFPSIYSLSELFPGLRLTRRCNMSRFMGLNQTHLDPCALHAESTQYGIPVKPLDKTLRALYDAPNPDAIWLSEAHSSRAQKSFRKTTGSAVWSARSTTIDEKSAAGRDACEYSSSQRTASRARLSCLHLRGQEAFFHG